MPKHGQSAADRRAFLLLSASCLVLAALRILTQRCAFAWLFNSRRTDCWQASRDVHVFQCALFPETSEWDSQGRMPIICFIHSLA